MECCGNPIKRQPRNCPHIAGFKVKGGSFNELLKDIRSYDAGLTTSLRSCADCGDFGPGWLHQCAQCSYVGCFKQKHIHRHFLESGHFVGVSVSHANIFCGQCGDYVYDGDFDFASRAARALALYDRIAHDEPDSKRAKFVPWQPKTRDQNALQHAQRMAVAPHLVGLRGLFNLGSTCFLNSILQAAFVHNPIVRNYFLSDQHSGKRCTVSPCLGCQMDSFFREMFSGAQHPFSPHAFLVAIWQHSEYFAGYEQQDAHEFFISALNGIHQHLSTSAGQMRLSTDMTTRCPCIIHQTFGAYLRSEVTCVHCNNISTSFDPCLDISLEIPAAVAMRNGQACSLEDCLRGFTEPEVLGHENRLMCTKCGTYQMAKKQMALEAAPIVLCVQIKRFQRTMGTRRMVSSKVETRVSFPFELDLTPYMSRAAQRQNRSHAAPLTNMYDLFAVVNHHGSLDNGHYTCFVQQIISNSQTEWVKCDDTILTRATAQQVHDSQAYLLFYCRRFLEYDAPASSAPPI